MNIILWILQILLALHTTMGAVWKFFHSPQSVPNLSAIPHGVWRTMSILELLCALGLLLPVIKTLGLLAPVTAIVIGAEMRMLCGVHIVRGTSQHGYMAYWLVVALVCGFIAYGRFVLAPI